MTGSEEIDEYVAALPDEQRRVMERLRELMTAAVPDAVEAISYKMPALRLDGRFFMSYNAFKDHYSIFPGTYLMNMELGEELLPHVKGKGTLQFSASEPLPEELIRKVVAIRLKEFQDGR